MYEILLCVSVIPSIPPNRTAWRLRAEVAHRVLHSESCSSVRLFLRYEDGVISPDQSIDTEKESYRREILDAVRFQCV